MGFSQGVSGINAAAANLDVIGNNIANAGTIGFKSGSVRFSDVYAGSKTGLGSSVSGVAQNFTAGAVQSTTKPLDVAIVDGEGFFRMASPSGEISYGRNGQFDVDKDGFVVNADGLRLTGYQVAANGTIGGGAPGPMQFQTGGMPPSATQKITTQFNIDSRQTVPTVTPFNANNSATYNYSTTATVFDSLGVSHQMSTFFTKTAANTFSINVTLDGGAAVAPTPASVTFDSTGKLTAPATGVPINITAFTLPAAAGATMSPIAVDITGTTQFGATNDVRKLTQDGYASGQLTSYAVGRDGILTGKYTNEQSKPLGQIVLSSFVNPGGLKPKGNNVYAETAESGQPLTGSPGVGTKLGSLVGGALEASNVDMTAELVNLIIAQRTYQANTQTVKTQDQVVQALINMR